MTHEQMTDLVSRFPTLEQVFNGNFLALPPYRKDADGVVFDSRGQRVLVCSEDTDCPLRFSEPMVDSDGHFCCPDCGRLGQRMVEAKPDQCGLTTAQIDIPQPWLPDEK